MKVTLLQTATHWGDARRNAALAERLMMTSPGSGLYVLPEMWDTGFDTCGLCPDAARERRSAGWMLSASRDSGAAVCGTIAVGVGGRMRNRMLMARPDGSLTAYDKRHLFAYGGEDRLFDAGGRRVIAEWGGLRWLLLVCYDLRFPVWARCRGDYDGIIISASWPASRIMAWDLLLRARAIENMCYVVACNRTGMSPAGAYCGHSVVIGPDGTVVARADGTGAQAVSAEVDAAAVDALRRRCRFLADADGFELRRDGKSTISSQDK